VASKVFLIFRRRTRTTSSRLRTCQMFLDMRQLICLNLILQKIICGKCTSLSQRLCVRLKVIYLSCLNSVGRIDDVIVHSSGEKTVPSPMEDVVLSSNQYVFGLMSTSYHSLDHLSILKSLMGVVIFGRNHDQPGILVEPKPSYAIDVEDEKQVVEFRNLIWYVMRILLTR